MTAKKMSSNKPYEALVIGGGGMKGVTMLGALEYYWKNGLLSPSITLEFAGTSIGGMIAFLLTIGYVPHEIYEAVATLPIFFGPFARIPDMTKNWGIFDYGPVFEKVKSMTEDKYGLSEMTFEEHYELTGKFLSLTRTNITRQCAEYLNKNTTPDKRVLDAIKETCNLPFIFPKIEENGNLYVDGGLSDNCPVSQVSERVKTLVVFTKTSEKSPRITDIQSYFTRILEIPISTISQLRMREVRNKPDVDVLELETSANVVTIIETKERLSQLYLSGFESAQQFAGKSKLSVFT